MQYHTSKSTTELLTQVRELELTAGRNATNRLMGNYETRIPGQGLLFREARRYVYGESIRKIDWNMSARMNEPYVRIFDEERQRNVLVALDVSESMHCGWQRLTKIEFALEMAATLIYSAAKAGDRVAALTFDEDSLTSTGRALTGRRAIFTGIETIIAGADSSPRREKLTDIRTVFQNLEAMRMKPAVVFIISDFIDEDIPDDLRYARMAHDISFLHIYDKLEYVPESPVRQSIRSSEKGMYFPVADLDHHYPLKSKHNFLSEAAGRYGFFAASFSTDMTVNRALEAYFHNRRRRQLYA